MRKAIVLVIISLCIGENTTWANDGLAATLIRRISSRIKTDAYFGNGLFPAYREYIYNKGTLKKGDNSFFSGLIVFTLRRLQPYLDTALQRPCKTVFDAVIPEYEKFRNRKGLPVYSFWQTKPVNYFPNSGWLSLFKANALPDDADCTSILLQAIDAPRPVAEAAHRHFGIFTNLSRHKIRSTYRPYKKIKAYSTWLGHHVPLDFDICVLSNILLLVNHYELPYTAADSASLYLISEMVRQQQYLSDPVYISPYYNKTSVILYHLSRLMESRYLPRLEKYRPQLVAACLQQYNKAVGFLDKTVLATSLLRWNVSFDVNRLNTGIENYMQNGDKSFVFFSANIASMLPNPLNKWLTASNMGKFFYYCPAYNDVLLLENITWQKRRDVFHPASTTISN